MDCLGWTFGASCGLMYGTSHPLNVFHRLNISKINLSVLIEPRLVEIV